MVKIHLKVIAQKLLIQNKELKKATHSKKLQKLSYKMMILKKYTQTMYQEKF